uniref:Uncharacterized protein LOC104242485 n=1 Tax=Nicotiana sylvestris TaxID=4096 RepID=A0A1U7YAK7_NICSY|nr:PREDICTED: uncharacterized protein LOC104242485 [Nicotiana sylvestris]
MVSEQQVSINYNRRVLNVKELSADDTASSQSDQMDQKEEMEPVSEGNSYSNMGSNDVLYLAS